ncbi:MAG: methylmalonyl-CoA epimerase [Candidatus Electryoneaceae bacterium]|nr:methylmalonyl-CoA epimerase [Candidatus Electryoneaceae bacterium]
MGLSFIMGTRLDHVAIAVRNIDAIVRIYRLLGVEPSERETIAEQGVELLMLPVGNTRLELLQPLDDDTPIGRFIAKRGEGLHHIALEVNDIESVLDRCRTEGVKSLMDKPRIGAGGSLIIFLDPRTTGGVLIELVQAIDT